MITGRTSRIAQAPARRWTPLVFALTLVVAFFAFAPAADACTHELVIHKVETGMLAPGGTYDIRITGPDMDRTLAVPADGSASIIGVPPGEYEFEELGHPDAMIDPNPLVIPANASSGGTVDVYVTNDYPGARLTITKIETGSAAPGGTYTFDIVGTGEEPLVLTATVTAGTTWTSGWLPLDTYTVTERDAPAGHVIVPNPVLLTDDGQTVEVTATNPYRDRHARLAITKIETGTAAPGGTHTFDIVGTGEEPLTLTATVTAGTTWTSDWLPLGTYTITERNAPAGHTITPNPVTLDTDEQTVTVTATNPYRDRHARLEITKIETGSAAPGGTHTFDIVGPVDLTATVTAGTTWTSEWLPLGTYTISERNAPAGHTITPNPVTLDTDEQTVTVTATNPYPAGRLAIQKVQPGVTGTAPVYTFEVHGPVTFNVQVAANSTWTSELLPLGTYTVTERNAPIGHTIVPSAAVLTTDGATVTVIATNPTVLQESSPPARLPATGARTDELVLLAGVVLAAGGLLAAAGHRRRSV